MSDIEVKGGIHTKEKNADLAKLPFSTFKPGSDRQSWDEDMLRQFQEMPIVPVQHLARIADELEKTANRSRAAACEERVRALKQAERENDKATIREYSLMDFAGAKWMVLFVHPERVTLRLLGPVPQGLAHRTYQISSWEHRIEAKPGELLPDIWR